MNFLIPNLSFKEDGPFVGLVVCYLCQVHGFNEIASRAIRRKMDQLDTADMEEAIEQLSDQRTREALKGIARGGITGLLAEPALYAEVGEKISVDIGALADTIYNDHKPALSYLNRLSAGGMLILAWETTSELRTKDPAWEFLRHCRNAAAHEGRFHLKNGEPRRQAAWRSKHITADLNGKLLFTDGLAAGFIGPGDVLYLLSDLDRR
ncbi:MAG: hypothetical protein ACREMS_00975 [Gemmatimonadaceae bacterium]